MAVTMPNRKQKGKHYISGIKPFLPENTKDIKETSVSFNDDIHGVHGEKTEHFSKLKKRLQKKTV